MAASMIAYGGAFSSKYRMHLEKHWEKELTTLNITHTPNVRMVTFLLN